MLGDSSAQQLENIPLSNDTVCRRISDISDDLRQQLIEKLRNKWTKRLIFIEMLI
jgi:hypothetical protein